MRKDDGSKMQKWTQKLRETHPAAAQCRLRRAKGHYELVGTLSDGRRIAKRLSGAEDEHEALEKAKDLTDQLMSGIATTRMLPQGMVARAERLALARIDLMEVRSATKAYHHRITKECASWLAERGLLVSQATLVNFYKEAPKTSRKRRERVEAARHLAKGALEAVYTGGKLSLGQIRQMTTGDDSAAAMANQMWSYWGDNSAPGLLA